MAKDSKRDWKGLVSDVLLELDGKEFTKEEFLRICSDEAYIRFHWQRGNRFIPKDDPTLYRNYDPEEGTPSRRYPYIGEKVMPWLLGAHMGRVFSRVKSQVARHGGFLRTLHEVMGLLVKAGPTWVEVVAASDGARMLRTWRPYSKVTAPLHMKAVLVPYRVLDVHAPHWEGLVALCRGNWRLVGDYLQDKEIDHVLGVKAAVDLEVALLVSYVVLDGDATWLSE